MKKIFLVIIIIIVAGAGLVFYELRKKDKTPVASETYKNSQYGFQISFPQNLKPELQFERYYALSNLWRAEAGPDSKGIPVVSIPVFRINQGGVATGRPYPLYFDAEVRIGVSNEPQDIANCYSTDLGYTNQKVTDVTINGIKFKKFDFGGAASMQYVQGESYRVIHNGYCYAVEQVKTGSSYRDDTMQPGIPDSQLNDYYNQAGDIIQTFKFMK